MLVSWICGSGYFSPTDTITTPGSLPRLPLLAPRTGTDSGFLDLVKSHKILSDNVECIDSDDTSESP